MIRLILLLFFLVGCSTSLQKNRTIAFFSSLKQTKVIGSAQIKIKKNDESNINWFFVAGGPGISADYFDGLTESIDVQGNIWHLDFPDKLIKGLIKPEEVVNSWKESILKIAQTYNNPIFVGHSSGGVIVLSTPEIKNYLKGLILLSTSPVNSRSSEARAYNNSQSDNLWDEYIKSPTSKNLKKLWSSWAELYFLDVGQGRRVLKKSRYYPHADSVADWFNYNYKFEWAPDSNNTLIIVGDRDLVQPLYLYGNIPEFSKLKEKAFIINNSGHFPWVENLEDSLQAIEGFGKNLLN